MRLKRLQDDLSLYVPVLLCYSMLILKAPIMTAADDIHKYFSLFSEKINLMFQVNPLLG